MMSTPTSHGHPNPEHRFDLAPPAPTLDEDEWVVDTPRMRRFIADVRAVLATVNSPPDGLVALRPVLGELLAEDGWLPEEFAESFEGSGMGGAIGKWLL